MKRDGVDRMFPFAKRDISEWGSRCEPKNNYETSIKYVRSNLVIFRHPLPLYASKQ